MNADWECPCDQCMGRLEPPDYEPSEEEIEAYFLEREQATSQERAGEL